MESSFYSLLFRQKFIKRWGLMRNVSDEDLAQHGAQAAILAHALASIGNRIFGKSYDLGKVVQAALYHDISEVITGDLPTPIKYYNAAIRDNYHEIEDNAVRLLLQKIPSALLPDYRDVLLCEDKEIHRIVKAADKLCALIKCLEEEASGNAEFRDAKAATLSSLQAFDCEELRWFTEHILPTFSETIDRM